MANSVKSFWVNTPAIAGDPEKHVKELEYLGADELFLLSIDGGGTLYPSKRFIESSVGGKDFLSPVINEARRHGMKVHSWVVTFNKPNKNLYSNHREWYVINKSGVSCVDKPPYVPSYLWLCPTQDASTEYLLGGFHELVERFDVDGVHLDYIRLPDVFLPEALRPRYGLEQRREVYKPEFDFCYCEVCRRGFRREHGVDPLMIEFGSRTWYEWVSWRANKISNFVCRFHNMVKSYDQSIETSAAVFATPGLAYRYVFQRWGFWPLDHVEPMIYHEYYGKEVDWIGEAVVEGVSTGKKVVAGIMLEFLRSEEAIKKAVEVAIQGGAHGICFFVYPIPRPELREQVRGVLRKL